MKKKSFICFLSVICILCTSCISSRIVTIDSGTFQYVKGDIKRTIVLKNDSQFSYIISLGIVEVKCCGKWSYINKDTILLQCDDEPLENAIVQGYMPCRNHKIKVLNIHKLKLFVDNNVKHKYFILNKIPSP